MSYLLGQMEATRIIAESMTETANEFLEKGRVDPTYKSATLLASAMTVAVIAASLFRAAEKMAEQVAAQTGKGKPDGE